MAFGWPDGVVPDVLGLEVVGLMVDGPVARAPVEAPWPIAGPATQIARILTAIPF
jgi:hypothetical protein